MIIKSRNIDNRLAFTLIELIVSITIFIIILISVTSIFISSNDIAMKTDINRAMQENIKNIVETISEDIRKYGIKGVSKSKPDVDCNSSGYSVGKYQIGNKFCTGNSEFYIAKKDLLGNFVRVDNLSDCQSLNDVCTLLKDGEPLSNSFVTFKEISFKISDESIKKLTINFVMQPSTKKGIKTKLIEENKIIFQTTISEKLIKTN
ncbi:hypothetical protein CSA08_01765 [Candidatus Gracilibacteria bacterium]|nr:MAG: hypothetical protein CSA08_01765 [Candidatus Gracilibacteria bacterium]